MTWASRTRTSPCASVRHPWYQSRSLGCAVPTRLLVFAAPWSYVYESTGVRAGENWRTRERGRWQHKESGTDCVRAAVRAASPDDDTHRPRHPRNTPGALEKKLAAKEKTLADALEAQQQTTEEHATSRAAIEADTAAHKDEAQKLAKKNAETQARFKAAVEKSKAFAAERSVDPHTNWWRLAGWLLVGC